MELRDVQVRGWGPWQGASWRNLTSGLNFLETPSETNDHDLCWYLACGLAQANPNWCGQQMPVPDQIRLRLADGESIITTKRNAKGGWTRSRSNATAQAEGANGDNADEFSFPDNPEWLDRFFAPYRHRPAGVWQLELPDLRDLLFTKKRNKPRAEVNIDTVSEASWDAMHNWLQQGNHVQHESERRVHEAWRVLDVPAKPAEPPASWLAWQAAWKDHQRWQTELEKLEIRLRRVRAYHRLTDWQRRWSRLQAEKPRLGGKQIASIRAAVPQLQALQKQRETLHRKQAKWEARRKRAQDLAGLGQPDTPLDNSDGAIAAETSPQELRKVLAKAKWAHSLERVRRRPRRVANSPAQVLPFAPGLVLNPAQMAAQQARREELQKELQQTQAILQTLRDQRQEAVLRQANVAQVEVTQEPVVPPVAWQRERNQLQQEFEAMRDEANSLRRECEQALQPTLMTEWQRMGIAGLFVGGIVAIVFGMFLNIHEPVWPVIGVGFTAIGAGVLLRMSSARVGTPRLTHQRARLHQLQFDMHENRRKWQRLDTSSSPSTSPPLPHASPEDVLSLAATGQEVAWLDTELEAANGRAEVLRQQLAQLGPELPFPLSAPIPVANPTPMVTGTAETTPEANATSAAKRRALHQWKQRAARCLRDPEVLAADYSVRRIAGRLRREDLALRRQQRRQQHARKQFRQAQVQERRWEKELKRCGQRIHAILRRFRCDDLAALLQLQKDGVEATRWHRQCQRLTRRVRSKLPAGITVQTLPTFLETEEQELGDVALPSLENRMNELRQKLLQGLPSLQFEVHRESVPASDSDWHQVRQQWIAAQEPVSEWMKQGAMLLANLKPRSIPAPTPVETEELTQTSTLRIASEWGALLTHQVGMQLGATDDFRVCVRSDANRDVKPLAALHEAQQEPLLFALRCAIALALHKKGFRSPFLVLGSDLSSETTEKLSILQQMAKEMQVIVVGGTSELASALVRVGANRVAAQLQRVEPAPEPAPVVEAAPIIVPPTPVPTPPAPADPTPEPVLVEPPREVLVQRELYEVHGPLRYSETDLRTQGWERSSGESHSRWHDVTVVDDETLWSTDIDRRSA